MTARVDLRLPSVLKDVTGRDHVRVRGRTVRDALEAAYEALPRLRYHLALESGDLRPHVLCVLNGEAVERDRLNETKLKDGDEIWIHQAISGG